MFFWEILKNFQNTFFIVNLWVATSDLIEYLETLTINYDSRKYLKILTIENIYRKYFEIWRSYETIWKPYLEHDLL